MDTNLPTTDSERGLAPPPTLPENGLDEPLRAELPTFELFFKTFGFKRIHGRLWGYLVLTGRPLSSREISDGLGISQGSTSTALNELAEWGAVASEFDSSRRCNLHRPVGNALSIVATVFRRREQVAFQQFKQTAERSLVYIADRYGERDPRVMTLRSIITTCQLAEALMQLIFSAVTNALGDSESILSKAIHAALKIGVGVPARVIGGKGVHFIGEGNGEAPPQPSPQRTNDATDGEVPAAGMSAADVMGETRG